MTGLVLVVLWFLQQGQWSPQLVSKSLVRKSQRKEKTTSVKVESVKIEASTCPDVFAKLLRGRLSATSVDSCWMPQRQIEQRSPSAERKNSESSGCKATSRASASSRSPSASWMRLGFLTTRHVAVLVLRLTC